MPPSLGTLRRTMLAPSLDAVGFARRGFPTGTAAATRLEAIPQAVVCGFEWGIEERRVATVERRLGFVEPELRGFAYEGATMAFTVRDAAFGGHRTRDLLGASGAAHIFLAYIGIGFAMARLPRPLWKKVLPDLPGSPFHPTMSWLAVDGYAFDRAYFDTARWVGRQRTTAPYPWQGCPGHPEYFPRAADQGVGRALWFIHAGAPDAVADAVEHYAEPRRADLWAGVGLAAAVAGGPPADGLAELRDRSGRYRPELALGAVFAIKARDYSGCVPEHTEAAAKELTGLSVPEAVGLADRTEPPASPDPPEPAPADGGPGVPRYERWRLAIRSRFA